jgi:hypothetical protein
MIRRHLFQILIAYIVVSIFCLHSYALEKESHKAINEYIARNTLNGFSLDSYLKDQLGIQEGIEETFNHNKVWKWMGEGGKKEDEPFTRSANHFHNPLTEQGFSGFWGTGWFDGESALFWAQKEKGAQDTDEPDENYSWYDTRDYFYNALTSTTESEQDNYFAKTFRGLGQLMHLVTDMSVPEHTRDDGHYLGVLPFYEHYEKWVAGKDKDKNPNVDILPELGVIEIKDTQITPESLICYDPVFLPSESQFPEAPVLIANLFDTNQYVNGGNPAITLHDPDSNIATIGLSEYTNANFLSPGTIFTSNFPYPNKEDCILAVDQSNNRLYLSNAGGGEQVDHLAVVSFLYLWRTTHFPQYGLLFLPVGLDSFCYEEYAVNLIPRAVGYSAALLDYFFRGKMDVTSLPIFFDEGTDTNLYFLRLKIKNMTESEETMSDGTYNLILRYRDGHEEKTVQALDVSSGEIQYGDEAEIDFELPFWAGADKISLGEYQSGVTCTLVFRGTLGNETDAVVGKIFTLGEEIKFGEAWDNGLTGNHAWDHIIAEPTPPNGSSTNIVENGFLTKENIREVGSMEARFNESILNLPGSGILITPNTHIEFKIDESAVTPYAPETCSWQDMVLGFNNRSICLEFSNGQWKDHGWPSMAYYSFTPGELTGGNIYQLLLDAGVDIPAQLNLDEIGFGQGLEELAEPSTVEHFQFMKIDFLRIIEEKQNQ